MFSCCCFLCVGERGVTLPRPHPPTHIHHATGPHHSMVVYSFPHPSVCAPRAVGLTGSPLRSSPFPAFFILSSAFDVLCAHCRLQEGRWYSVLFRTLFLTHHRPRLYSRTSSLTVVCVCVCVTELNLFYMRCVAACPALRRCRKYAQTYVWTWFGVCVMGEGDVSESVRKNRKGARVVHVTSFVLLHAHKVSRSPSTLTHPPPVDRKSVV